LNLKLLEQQLEVISFSLITKTVIG